MVILLHIAIQHPDSCLAWLSAGQAKKQKTKNKITSRRTCPSESGCCLVSDCETKPEKPFKKKIKELNDVKKESKGYKNWERPRVTFPLPPAI